MANTLPPELLTKILLNLDSIELIRASAVNPLWKALIDKDPSLRRSCFRYPSLHYYDEGCEYTDLTQYSKANSPCNIRFHPAMSRISYRVGEDVSSAYLSAPQNERRTSLLNSSLKDDYISIPIIHSMDIEIIPDPSLIDRRPKTSIAYYLPGITLTVENPRGIRVIDLFSSIAVASSQLCDLISYASGGRFHHALHARQRAIYFKKADILGKYKSYSGIHNATIKNGRIRLKLYTNL